MMIIDVRKLNAQKKYSGELEFTFKPTEDLIDIPFVKFSGNVKVVADYVLYEDDSLDLKGKVLYVIEGQCSRCLNDAKQSVEGELDAYFQPFEDGEDYSYSGGIINVEDAIKDAILLSMPKVLLCSENCEGIKFQ